MSLPPVVLHDSYGWNLNLTMSTGEESQNDHIAQNKDSTISVSTLRESVVSVNVSTEYNSATLKLP